MGEPEDRTLITGVHTVCDVFCVSCQTVLGWKYVCVSVLCAIDDATNEIIDSGLDETQEDAKEESQKYKVGKFIVEKVYLVKEADWE